MKKVLLSVLGIAAGAFAVAQALQSVGLIGTKNANLPGFAFILFGTAISVYCFQKVFGKPKPKKPE